MSTKARSYIVLSFNNKLMSGYFVVFSYTHFGYVKKKKANFTNYKYNDFPEIKLKIKVTTCLISNIVCLY